MNDLMVTGKYINDNYPELYHFSKNPLVLFKQLYQQSNPLKPHGLWFSDENSYGWAKWCKAEDFYLNDLSHKYKITLFMGKKK